LTLALTISHGSQVKSRQTSRPWQPAKEPLSTTSSERWPPTPSVIGNFTKRSVQFGPTATDLVLTQNMHARPIAKSAADRAAVKMANSIHTYIGRNLTPAMHECLPATHFANAQESRSEHCARLIRSLPTPLQPDVVCFQELQGECVGIMDSGMEADASTDYPSPPFKRERSCYRDAPSGPALGCLETERDW